MEEINQDVLTNACLEYLTSMVDIDSWLDSIDSPIAHRYRKIYDELRFNKRVTIDDILIVNTKYEDMMIERTYSSTDL